MKTFAIVNLLAVLCVAAGMDPGSVMNAVQTSIGKVSHVAHQQVEKRQTFHELTIQDMVSCSSAIVEYECSSGYAQETINIALGCRNYMPVARATSIICARNGAGQTCGAALFAVSSDETQSVNSVTCYRAVSQGHCPSTCRSYLQFARSRLGCCVNTLLNTTDSPLYDLYSEYVDYRLWNLCNVDLPPADCGNTLPLNPPPDAKICTFEELLARTVNYECMASVGQPLIDAVLQNRRCYPYARLLADACGINVNGNFCADAIGQDILIGSESTNHLLVSLRDYCYEFDSTCTPFCQSLVANVSEILGCCVNIYNSSDFEFEQSSLTYSYWNLCGVETPGFCTSTLNSGTAMKAFAWLIVAAMTLMYVV